MSCDCHYNFVIFSRGAKVWEKQTALLYLPPKKGGAIYIQRMDRCEHFLFPVAPLYALCTVLFTNMAELLNYKLYMRTFRKSFDLTETAYFRFIKVCVCLVCLIFLAAANNSSYFYGIGESANLYFLSI